MASSRGKGSEIILLKPDSEGTTKGVQYPIKTTEKKLIIFLKTGAFKLIALSGQISWQQTHLIQ